MKKWSVLLIIALIIPVSLSFSVPASACAGCTPGYWKQPQHFDSWEGYSPDDSLDDIFAEFPDMTLLQALSARKGDHGLSGLEAALVRHAVAALLNDAAELFDSDVAGYVTWAYGNGDMEEIKDYLAAANEGGCPLD